MTQPIFNDAFYQDPHATYQRLRETGPVHLLPEKGAPTWLIIGYTDARVALADPRLSKDTRRARHIFSKNPTPRDIAPAIAHNMLATDPPDHTRLRRLVAKAFTPAAATRLAPRIHQLANQLIDTIIDRGGQADLIADYAAPLPVNVISELLGVPHPDRQPLRQHSNNLFAAGDANLRDQASHHIADYMTHLVDYKHTHPGDDLLTELIAIHQAGDHLSRDELISLACLLLIAGHETTTNLIGNALHALLHHPDQLNHLRHNPHHIPQAIEEILRYESPLTIATIRHTLQPIQTSTLEIPANQLVMIGIGAANRDPHQFPNPHTLDITRTPTQHLAFGHGPHHCAGTHLARLETRIALQTILTRLPTILPSAGTPEWRRSRLMRGLERQLCT